MLYLTTGYILFWLLIFFYIGKMKKTTTELEKKVEMLEKKLAD